MLQVYVTHFIEILTSVVEYIQIKLAAGVLLVGLSFFFSPELWNATLAILCLVVFDAVSGVVAAKKVGEPIRSRKLCKTAFKLAIYGLLISSAHLTDFATGIPLSWLSVEVAMIGFLAATELLSIVENAGKMGIAIPVRIVKNLEKLKSGKKN